MELKVDIHCSRRDSRHEDKNKAQKQNATKTHKANALVRFVPSVQAKATTGVGESAALGATAGSTEAPHSRFPLTKLLHMLGKRGCCCLLS